MNALRAGSAASLETETRHLFKEQYDRRYYRKNRAKRLSQSKRQYRRNKGPRKVYMRVYRAGHGEAFKGYKRKSYAKLRKEVLDAYGNACACCGVSQEKFLSMDHINGGGQRHRASIGHGNAFYRWLKEKGFPKNEFQLLCHNCNFAKGIYGVCPHKEMK
ncbi:hypothetical protein LCGC14_2107650 [marine sediment metagenome]|uniref:HNH domain-containing protein n=1 Tax=marine sediment metagenome TaxID=412755 RepID=A0A0F9EV85_9ZZZZ